MTQSFSNSFHDRPIPAFPQGKLLHYPGIKAFPEVAYIENVRKSDTSDVAIVAVPPDAGTTYANSLPDVKQST